MKLNLKELYPDLYSGDEDIVVDEEIAEVIRRDKLQQEAYRIKNIRYKVYLSLDSEIDCQKISKGHL